MLKLATFIMAGRMQACTAVVGFALLALILLPLTLLLGKLGLAIVTLLTLFSGASLALVALRLGATEGLAVLTFSTALMVILNYLFVGRVEAGLAYSLLQWAPLLVPALVLRNTVSMALAMVAAIGLGGAVILGAHLAIPDLPGFWAGLLDEYLRQAMVQSEGSADIVADDLQTAVETAARFMTGSLVASMLLSMSLMILIARWWQSLLYNPGGFRQEFRELRLGILPALVGLCLLVAAWLSGVGILAELAVVSLVLFILQGVAIVHDLSAGTKNPSLVLGGFYTALVMAYLISGDIGSIFVFSALMAGLCALGLIDALTDLRARLKKRRQENG
jgi:hypothetical protein